LARGSGRPSPAATNPRASTIASIAFALLADIARRKASAKAAARDSRAPTVGPAANGTAVSHVAWPSTSSFCRQAGGRRSNFDVFMYHLPAENYLTSRKVMRKE